jgi:hypothetical protein
VLREDQAAGKGEGAASAKKGAKRHGDSAIADLMAFVATLAPPAPIEFQSAGRRQAHAGLGDYLGRSGAGGRDTRGYF